MALIKIQRELIQVAERLDRRGKHELAEKIRETIEELRWSGFNSRITLAFNMALESNLSTTFNKILPKVALFSGYTVDELKKIPHIEEYFDYAKGLAKRRAARERDFQKRLMMR
jgi:hypothetical protein